MLAEERLPLHVRRYGNSGERQHGRCEIDAADQLVVRFSGMFAVRKPHDERNVRASFEQLAFHPGKAAAVIAVEKDVGVVVQAIVLEHGEQLANLVVQDFDVREQPAMSRRMTGVSG